MKGVTVRDLLETLVDELDRPELSTLGVIPWAGPVPFFGDLMASRVATVGINPSNQEFRDRDGNELVGDRIRLHTLKSLGIQSWGDVDDTHLSQISEACRTYFLRENPYNGWFRKLDHVVAGAGASFYADDGRHPACHLDLVPYATNNKWSQLTSHQRRSFFDMVPDDLLGLLLRGSPARVVILNGQAVVKRFETIAGLRLKSREMPDWSLSRSSQPDRPGRAYCGAVDTLCGVNLRKKVTVLGFNHNLQGTFGMTSQVITAIRNWISKQTGL